jgi:hypothetical protein
MRLADLQQQFSQALHYQASGEECNIVADQFSAEQRMQVYRNNFVIGLSELLQLTYPCVHALVGDECFAGLARSHVLTQPLQQADVSRYGEHFDHTIAAQPAVVTSVPYLAQLAALEYALDNSYQVMARVGSDNALQPLSALAQLSEDEQSRIRLHLQPGVEAIASDYALFSIYHTVQNNKFDNIDTNTAEQGLVLQDVEQPALAVALEPDAYQLLLLLQQQLPLNQIADKALAELPTLLQFPVIAGFSLEEIQE